MGPPPEPIAAIPDNYLENLLQDWENEMQRRERPDVPDFPAYRTTEGGEDAYMGLPYGRREFPQGQVPFAEGIPIANFPEEPVERPRKRALEYDYPGLWDFDEEGAVGPLELQRAEKRRLQRRESQVSQARNTIPKRFCPPPGLNVEEQNAFNREHLGWMSGYALKPMIRNDWKFPSWTWEPD
jgi:hypothetical protein